MEYSAQEDTLTKHETILRYITQLKVGSKISVRKIAKEMGVSEGTAYRAIKEAESQGLVSTKDRIGSVRIEKKQRHNIDKLTYGEVVNIVDGEVLGGADGLHKSLNKFVIGAMQEEAMLRYIEAGNLLIVGNRQKAQQIALETGAAVLITGGFEPSPEIVQLADELGLPIISSSYDTFTVASMINRAIYDRLIKKKIMLVQDIISPQSIVYALKSSQKVKELRQLIEESGHNRFPVVDEWNRVVGMVTSKHLVDAGPEQTVDRVMTRNPITIHLQATIASAAHLMVWEGIELLPVIDANRKIVGVISRKDVLKVMQYIQRQPQIGETFEDLIWSGFEEMKSEDGTIWFKGMVTPQMTNHLGAASAGVLTTLMTQAAYRAVQNSRKGDLVIDNISTYYLRPVQMETEVEIRPNVIEVSRKYGKIDVEIYHGGQLVAKAMVTAQMFDQA
ncbi:putative manganese-dependent inorganic pyrophosphatase [Chlamydia abortus]|uniref:DRTGG domain-containing protein n=1 Tax=Paenibacillus residui TaxID=629724 RepID=A0ABW3DG87_9BACL|nr:MULTISPECIES: DRTGG domain-containing protein [Paenibacillaceae]SHE14668.1 putative manganese-dependent inorganic pyrophosphatase [Chlamydia abortus]